MISADDLSATKLFIESSLDNTNLPKDIYSIIIEYSVDSRGLKYFEHMLKYVGDHRFNRKFNQAYNFVMPCIATAVLDIYGITWNFGFCESKNDPTLLNTQLSVFNNLPAQDPIYVGNEYIKRTELWDFINGEESTKINKMVTFTGIAADLYELTAVMRYDLWHIVAHSVAIRDCADTAMARNRWRLHI